MGSLKDKKVTALSDPDENATGTSAAEGVVVDSMGNVPAQKLDREPSRSTRRSKERTESGNWVVW